MITLVRILLYIVAAFFLYLGSFTVFLHIPMPGTEAIVGAASPKDVAMAAMVAKVAMGVIFLILAAIPMLIALATKRFRNWKTPLGSMLITIAAIHVFSLISFLCIQASGIFPPELLQKQEILMQNLFSLIATIFGIGAIGLLLIRAEPKADI